MEYVKRAIPMYFCKWQIKHHSISLPLVQEGALIPYPADFRLCHVFSFNPPAFVKPHLHPCSLEPHSLPQTRCQKVLCAPPALTPAYLEVNPVDSVSDILKHALVGHEEVSVLKTLFTAKGAKIAGPCDDRPEPYTQLTFSHACFKRDSLPLFEVSSQTGKLSPPKRPTVISENVHPFQITNSQITTLCECYCISLLLPLTRSITWAAYDTRLIQRGNGNARENPISPCNLINISTCMACWYARDFHAIPYWWDIRIWQQRASYIKKGN